MSCACRSRRQTPLRRRPQSGTFPKCPGQVLKGLGIAFSLLLVSFQPAVAQRQTASSPPAGSKTEQVLEQLDPGIDWPNAETWERVLWLQDYNTRIVALGTLLLGMTAGVVGVFVLLRKRALVGDVVGHASLPGIGVAFLVLELSSPESGRWLPGLLFGATLAGMLGVLANAAIVHWTRIKEDAALAIVLSVFFGAGIVLFTVIQNMPSGHSAGLSKFIFGTAASMLASDVWLIGGASLIVLIACTVLFKELSLLCFDDSYARAQGWPTVTLDLLLMGLVVAVAEIGAQSVGLILVVALMIIPASAARFWTEDLRRMTWLSAVIGGGSAVVGVLLSALMAKLAAGATIVLVGGFFFLLSMFLGTRRGLVWRWLSHWQLQRRVGQHDLLRTLFELLEARGADGRGLADPEREQFAWLSEADIQEMRSWHTGRLRRLLRQAENKRLLVREPGQRVRLTRRGLAEAYRAARNHRMWELFLIRYADTAPSQVDRDADRIEHVLSPEMIMELETLLEQEHPQMTVPPSPHGIEIPVDSVSVEPFDAEQTSERMAHGSRLRVADKDEAEQGEAEYPGKRAGNSAATTDRSAEQGGSDAS